MVDKHPSRIAVTGLGILSASGTDKEAFFDGLCRDTDPPPPAEPEKNLVNRFGIRHPRFKIARYMDPSAKNAIVALDQALSDASIESDRIEDDPYNYALVFGTQRGPASTRKMLYDGFEKKERKLVSGTLFSHCGYNMAAAMTAVAFGIKGPNLTFSGKSDLGIYLLRRARQLLLSRRVHTVFVGFSESIIEDGAVKELACILILEDMGHALQRSAESPLEYQENMCETSALQSGKLYACGPAEDLSRSELLTTQVHENRVAFKTLLPLIKLGLLSGNREHPALLMPTRTNNGLSTVILRKTDVL